MKALVQVGHGEAAAALRIEEHADPMPGPGQIVVAMELAPIHRSDLGHLTGATKVPATDLPRILGVEGVGKVVAAAADVTRFKCGDRVFPPKYRGTFREQLACPAADCFAAPQGTPAGQLSIICTMGLTAALVLEDYVDLPAGHWLIHNGANSSIGQMVLGLARDRGLKTVNVVRRVGFENKLHALGGDAVIIDPGDADLLATRVAAATGGAGVHVALDMIGGDAGGRLAHTLAKPGKLVLYGSSGGEPARIDYLDFNRNELTIAGMSMSRSFNRRTPQEQDDVMRWLGNAAERAAIHTDIAGIYDLDQFTAAFAHAALPSRERNGKILFRISPEGLT